MSFEYQPLGGDAVQIRVLRLRPMTSAERAAQSLHIPVHLSCTLHHITLSEIEKGSAVFNALSYTWREPPATREISVNGQPFAIRENLWQFLLVAASRPDVCSSPLWVDQICINQNSNAERNHQVAHMATIYQQAKNVFMWLGPSSEATSETLGALQDAPLRCAILQRLNDPLPHRGLAPSDPDPPFWELVFSESASFMAGLHEILHRPFWARLWTVQEILSGPPETRVVFCGSRQMPWHLFQRYVFEILSKGISVARDHRQYLQTFPNLVDNHSLELEAFFALATMDTAELSRKPVIELLSHFGPMLCTDRRDHVYGLMGLVLPDSRIVADYNLGRLAILALLVENIPVDERQDASKYSHLVNIYAAVMGLSRDQADDEFNTFLHVFHGCVSLWRACRIVASFNLPALSHFETVQGKMRYPLLQKRPDLRCDALPELFQQILHFNFRGDTFVAELVNNHLKVEAQFRQLLQFMCIAIQCEDLAMMAMDRALSPRIRCTEYLWHFDISEAGSASKRIFTEFLRVLMKPSPSWKYPANIEIVQIVCTSLRQADLRRTWKVADPEDDNAVGLHQLSRVCFLKPWQDSHDPTNCKFRDHFYKAVGSKS